MRQESVSRCTDGTDVDCPRSAWSSWLSSSSSSSAWSRWSRPLGRQRLAASQGETGCAPSPSGGCTPATTAARGTSPLVGSPDKSRIGRSTTHSPQPAATKQPSGQQAARKQPASRPLLRPAAGTHQATPNTTPTQYPHGQPRARESGPRQSSQGQDHAYFHFSRSPPSPSTAPTQQLAANPVRVQHGSHFVPTFGTPVRAVAVPRARGATLAQAALPHEPLSGPKPLLGNIISTIACLSSFPPLPPFSSPPWTG